MSTGYVIPVDPHDLANNHAVSYDPREEGEDDLDVFTFDLDCEGVLSLLGGISKFEADVLELYYRRGKRQLDIARIFGVTQAAVSYRLTRSLERLRFLLHLPRVTEEDIREDLQDIFPQEIDLDILAGMWRTTCQSEVAASLKRTQGQVRHRFFKAVRTLEREAELDPKYVPYQKVFSAIAKKNFNVKKEVALPQWCNRGGDICV